MTTIPSSAEILAAAIAASGKPSTTLIQHNVKTTRALVSAADAVGISAEVIGCSGGRWLLVINDSAHGIAGTRAEQHSKLAHEIRERMIEAAMSA
jgi:hypothetical protein